MYKKRVLLFVILLITAIGYSDEIKDIQIEDFVIKWENESEKDASRPRFFLYKSYTIAQYRQTIGVPNKIETIKPKARGNPYNYEKEIIHYDDIELSCLSIYEPRRVIAIKITGDSYQTYRGLTIGDNVATMIDKYGDAHSVEKNENGTFTYYYQSPDPFANNYITRLSLEITVKQEGMKVVVEEILVSIRHAI